MRMIKQVKELFDEQTKKNYHLFLAKKEMMFTQMPDIPFLLQSINQSWVDSLKGVISEIERDKKIKSLRSQISKILIKNGYAETDLEYAPLCSLCGDKGFVDGHMCICLKQMHIEECYSQSNIKQQLLKENFETFNELIFSDTAGEEDKTQRINVLIARDKCLSFAQNFDTCGYNLLLSGAVGTGKTFLSHCISKYLIDRGKTVVYYTAYELVEKMTDVTLGRSDKNLAEIIWDCDLIILDDLGCERQTDYAQNLLFHLLNERLIRNKRMVISTNFTAKELKETYNERIFSRILGSFNGIRFYGDDVRLKIKA